MLSIVNPSVERNGASTVTRGLIRLLEAHPIGAKVDCLPARAQPFRWPRLAQARSLIHRCSTLPLKAAFLYSREFREQVSARARSGHYDLVVLNGADLSWVTAYLPESIPRILIAHNIEHELFRYQIERLNGWYRPFAGLLQKDCQRLQNYELEGFRRAGNVIFLSAEDAAYAANLCSGIRATTIPPVFDYPPYAQLRKRTGPTLNVGFVGNRRWWPNQLALRWFADEVLPFVQSPMRVHLFGRSGSGGLRADPRFVEHGEVSQIDEVWDNCDFLICPAFPTGGVCVKFAEAVYNRMPVLSTRHGARGLPTGDDPALVSLDRAEEWVNFLNSPAAMAMTERRVSEKEAAKFALHVYKDQLQKFVASARAFGAAHEIQG